MTLRRALGWALRIGLTVLVTWFILSQVGVRAADALAVRDAIRDPSVPLLLLASALFLGASVLVARLWGRMVGELGGRDPGGLPSVRTVFTANLGRYLPGKVWPVAGLAALARRGGESGTRAAAAGLLGQGFSLVAAGIVAAPALAGAEGSGAGQGTALRMGVILALALLALGSPALLRAGLRGGFRLAHLPAEEAPDLDRFFGPRWLGWHLLGWGGYGVAFVLFVRGLGFGGDPFGVAGAFAGAYLLGYLALFAPAGLGVREGFLVAFLPESFGGSAVGVAVLARLWMTILELAPAAVLALGFAFERGGDGRAR